LPLENFEYLPLMLPENQMQECIVKGRLVRVLANRCPPFPGRHLYYPSRRLAVQTFALFVEALRYSGSNR
jgi:DNA-binding transcriptional LysR family regulator